MNDKNYNAPAKKGGIRLLTLLMVFVIAITAVVNSICVYNVLGGDPQDNLNATGLSSEQATIKKKYDSKIKQTKAAM